MNERTAAIRLMRLSAEMLQAAADLMEPADAASVAIAAVAAPIKLLQGEPLKPADPINRKLVAAGPESDDEHEDDDDDDEEPTPRRKADKRPNKVVSYGETATKIGAFLRKIGVGQTFNGEQVNELFDGEVSPNTILNALNSWIAQGFIERTKTGNRWKPSEYRKLRAMEHED